VLQNKPSNSDFGYSHNSSSAQSGTYTGTAPPTSYQPGGQHGNSQSHGAPQGQHGGSQGGYGQSQHQGSNQAPGGQYGSNQHGSNQHGSNQHGNNQYGSPGPQQHSQPGQYGAQAGYGGQPQHSYGQQGSSGYGTQGMLCRCSLLFSSVCYIYTTILTPFSRLWRSCALSKPKPWWWPGLLRRTSEL
jgi:hypothetical protein